MGSNCHGAHFVIDLNRVRRHLTDSQWAMIAAQDILPYQEELAAARRTATGTGRPLPAVAGNGPEGEAADVAGQVVGVSGDSVARVKKVLDQMPQLADMMRAGIGNWVDR